MHERLIYRACSKNMETRRGSDGGDASDGLETDTAETAAVLGVPCMEMEIVLLYMLMVMISNTCIVIDVMKWAICVPFISFGHQISLVFSVIIQSKY